MYPNKTFDPYILSMTCEVIQPVIVPTPLVCPYTPIWCGSEIDGQLGYTNVSTYNSTTLIGPDPYDVFYLSTPKDSGNLTITVTTCAPSTTFDTYLAMWDGCPVNATAVNGSSLIASNDDDMACRDTSVGASTVQLMVSGDRVGVYLSVEKYGSAFRPDAIDLYTLKVQCEVPQPFVEPTPCPYRDLQCGDSVHDYLGFHRNVTNTTFHDPDSALHVDGDTHHIYALNVSAGWSNRTIIATTCTSDLTFDSMLSLYDECPDVVNRRGHHLVSVNDDDPNCLLAEGASSLEVVVQANTTEQFFVIVERYAGGAELVWRAGEVFEYALDLICSIPQPYVPPTPEVCEATHMECGECVESYLGWFNSTNATMPTDKAVESQLFALNVSGVDNTTFYLSTCSAHTTFDTVVGLWDECPTLFSKNATLLTSGDDDEECGLTDAGASTIEYHTYRDRGDKYASVELYGEGEALEFDPAVRYNFELCLICEIEVPETLPPTPYPTATPTAEEFVCPAAPLDCGDSDLGALGYNISVSDESNTTSTERYMLDSPITSALYALNATYDEYGPLNNVTISISTCGARTNFDSVVTVFSGCPGDPTGNVTMVAMSDDDEACVDTTSGASTAHYHVHERGIVYAAVELYSQGGGIRFDRDRSYEYEIFLQCRVILPTPLPTPQPTLITPRPTQPTPAPTRSCDYIPLECGESVMGYLGHHNNYTLVNSSAPVTSVLYGFVAAFNESTMPWFEFNTSAGATTCSEYTTVDTYLSMYDQCPGADESALLVDANDDDMYCMDTPVGASSVSTYLNGTTSLFVSVEASEPVFDPRVTYQYELTVRCDVLTPEPTFAPTALPTIFGPPTPEPSIPPSVPPTVEPTMAPTIRPTPHICNYIPISCGDVLSGILATNVTNATVPDGVGVDIYGFNVSDAYSNKTVITSTCAGPTTFDTHVSIFDSCPTDPSGGASVIATNDDDEYCSSTDSGASTSVFGVPKHTNFFYVAVERYGPDTTPAALGLLRYSCFLHYIYDSKLTRLVPPQVLPRTARGPPEGRTKPRVLVGALVLPGR